MISRLKREFKRKRNDRNNCKRPYQPIKRCQFIFNNKLNKNNSLHSNIGEQMGFGIQSVGKGLHSKDNEAKLKPEITGYLKKHGFSIDELDANSGCIIVSQPSIFTSVT